MPSKEIKELRKAKKFQEAYDLAKTEYNENPENIWSKRNLIWPIYDLLKISVDAKDYIKIKDRLSEIQTIKLPQDEIFFYDSLNWVIGKYIFSICRYEDPTSLQNLISSKILPILNEIESLPLYRQSSSYSFLFKAFHKALKEHNSYIKFADWWDFENFKPEDYLKEKLQDGKEIMSIVEQAYIAYSKQLLPKHTVLGDLQLNKEKINAFLPQLSSIVDRYPQFQYPAYFKVKLLIAIGDKDNILSTLLPFAKKKSNDFWVWELLSEAFLSDDEKILACYCKALSCKSPEEMLVSLRQKMASIFIKMQKFNEAKTEIELLVKARHSKDFKIPTEVSNWQNNEWYKTAIAKSSNIDFYKQYFDIAEGLLFSDVQEELAIVEFVNAEKKVVNFIASEDKFGFFNYGKFLKNVETGDVLKIRFKDGQKEGLYKVYTVAKCADEDDFKNKFLKSVNGQVKIPQGKLFGFINDIFIHPSIMTKYKLLNGQRIKGVAIKSYNSEKKIFSWKVFQVTID